MFLLRKSKRKTKAIFNKMSPWDIINNTIIKIGHNYSSINCWHAFLKTKESKLIHHWMSS